MRANAVISLAVLLALVMIPLTALAQDEIKYETYTSEDGLLSVAYPEGWASGFDTEMSFPCLLYTSDAADDLLCVDFGGPRTLKKKTKKKKQHTTPLPT